MARSRSPRTSRLCSLAVRSACDYALAQIHDDEIVDLTQALVRIPSVFRADVPDAGEALVARAVAAWLGEAGLSVEAQEVAPGRPNVVAWLDGVEPGPTLCLEGHTDVVTEGDPAAWRHGPWSGTVEQGRLYGRGAADMKGGLAAAMVAAAAVRRSGLRFRGRLLVAALVDEEGGMAGARHFMRTPIGRTVDAAIICEPEQNEICLEQKGALWVRITALGRMAHGAMPYAGANPIAAVTRFVAGLGALERRVRRGVARSRLLGPAYVTPTSCRAPAVGIAQNNVIPGSAELRLDVRLVPGLAPETVLGQLEALARDTERRCPGIRLALAALEPPRPATRTDRAAPVARSLAWAVERVTGRPPRYGGVPGSTDGTMFVLERGIPVVTFGPGPRHVPHQVDEFVEVRELGEAARCYAAAATRFLEARA